MWDVKTLESKIEHTTVPINVFMFIKTISEGIEVVCNLKILRNCRRMYSFVFLYDMYSYSLFEMNDKLNVFNIKFFNGAWIITNDKNSFENKLNNQIKNDKTSDINRKILVWIKENYLQLNNNFPFRFGL